MRASHAALATLLAAASLAGSVRADEGSVLPFHATEKTLANGLKVIVVPTGFPNIVSLQIPVQTGSRNEVEPGKSGFAHFFEHIMFRGTKAYPPEKYQAILTRAGAEQNAYTTDDYTNFYTNFSKQDLETVLKIEADRFERLAYDEAAFKTESRAILGEYNKDSADPVEKLIEVQRDHAFKRHTYKHTTMGFLADIEDMPNQYAYSKTFFDRWYRPEHVTVIVAGDVSADEVLPLVEKYWGSWQPGTFHADIPVEPPADGPVVADVEWQAPTAPWVSVAFHGPAFSATDKDWAALDLFADLTFGPTSELYKKLVQDEQKVDQFFPYFPDNQDPYLLTVAARVKRAEDATYVRDEILRAFAAARLAPPSAQRVEEAKEHNRYALLRRLDNTSTIAATLARFVRHDRSYDTINQVYATGATLAPADVLAAVQKYVTDANLVQTTLSHGALPAAIATVPPLASLAPAEPAKLDTIVQQSPLPELDVKLLFDIGSAYDPPGKEGLAALSAAMIAEAGSRSTNYSEIQKALFPMAASFEQQVDREMTTFTARVHRDEWASFASIALPQLTEPGFRKEDLERLKDQQLNALQLDLRINNDEELGKERLQQLVFAGTPYGHPTLGTVAGIQAITLDDVRDFVHRAYTRAALHVGLSGDIPEGLQAQLGRELAKLPEGPALPAPQGVVGHAGPGIHVDIVQKETRATAISIGLPIPVTRSSPDFVALYLARTWLGEHRSSMSHLYQRIREIRGMNYGDYAYVEAFPRGMFQFYPDPNLARRAQLFEIWIRPVVPDNAHMALRIAIFELRKLIDKGMTRADFESTRDYLMKHVFVMTATQDQQLGYALDSEWFRIPEYTRYMRDGLQKLTRADVNAALGKYLSGTNLEVAIVTRDAEGLEKALLSDAFSPIHYDASKPKSLLDEDRVIGALKLHLRPQDVTITPVDEVFAK